VARRDIQPYSSPNGSHNLRALNLVTGGQNILEGEPVAHFSGGILECSSDPPTVAGICAVPSARPNAQGVIGVIPDGSTMLVYDHANGQLFVTANFSTGGAGVAVVPTVANAVGQLAGLILTSGSWFVDTGASNQIIEIETVLTRYGRPIQGPGTSGLTGYQVVFRFIQ
jgi:hypothetical protein